MKKNLLTYVTEIINYEKKKYNQLDLNHPIIQLTHFICGTSNKQQKKHRKK